MFATPELGIFQDLSATYEEGRSYHLSVRIRGGSQGMELGRPIEIQLYYRDGSDAIVPIAVTEFLNDNLDSPTHLVEVTADLAEVEASDAWAGEDIGIRILSTATESNQGGAWDIDNVRLTAVPEPATVALVAIGGAIGLAARRRRQG
jgi:hypothetical protein